MIRQLFLQVDEAGVALITIDVPGRPDNVLTPTLAEELRAVVSMIKESDEITGAIIISGKSANFLAGGDLEEFASVHERRPGERDAAAMVAGAAAALRELETCGKPVAAAINGTASGGGYELCLACHHRVLVESPKAVVGLPEVTFGLLPACGGTQRLPRLIGIEKALPLLLSGRQVKPNEALALGLVDQISTADRLIETAREWVLAHPGFRQPWDVHGFAIPGGAGALAAHAATSFETEAVRVRRETQDNYPAPLAILSCVHEGSQLPFERALVIESKYFGALIGGPVARNLMRTMFINRGAAQKLARRPAGIPKRPVRRLGVLGAGMMGAGIAQVAAAAGIDVVLVDASQAGAESGKARLAAAYERDRAAGRCTSAEPAARLARVHPTADYTALRGCDFIVEAVFENREVKAAAYQSVREAMDRVDDTFVFATNTSTLPVSGLAAHWPDPARFIGVHFFSPVERMALVEIILGERTSPATLARALDLVAQLGKTPIVVRDSPGFYTSRTFCAYVDEGMAMLAEGIAPALIENAARQAGFATGPLAVIDEVSLDLQKLVIDQAHTDGLPRKFLREHSRAVVEKMLGAGRLGRKSGGGFHDFPKGEPKRLWTGLAELFPTAASQPPLADVKHRLLYIQALESARCMEEGVVMETADADLGSVLALGYPSWTGGTLSLIDTVGLPQFIRECDRFAAQYGERFRVSAWLRERAAAGQTFHANPRIVRSDDGFRRAVA